MNDLVPQSLIERARDVVSENSKAGRMLTIAESCTGGMATTAITEIPGSSVVLAASFVTYSDDSKMSMLDVPRDILETFGSVSVACAWAMAQGALAKTGADVAVAISGIAGPDGGSASKPIGTVVFARAYKGQAPEDVFAERINFDPTGTRSEIREQAALYALGLLIPEADSSAGSEAGSA